MFILPNFHALKYVTCSDFLFDLVSGLERDGWTIGENPAELSYAITTRQRTSCPNQVSMGYERDLDADSTFSIVCKEEE